MNLSERPVDDIYGVGPTQAELLHQHQLHTVEDVLLYFPFRYEDYSIRDIREAVDGEAVTVVGTVQTQPLVKFFGKKKSKMTVKLLSGGQLIALLFFNQAFHKAKLQIGATVTANGKWNRARAELTVTKLTVGDTAEKSARVPVYPAKGELTSAKFKRIIDTALQSFGDDVEEFLPEEMLHAYKLPVRKHALQELHLFTSASQLKHARRRFVYEEFLLFQLKMQLFKHHERQASVGVATTIDNEAIEGFMATLPFSLTKAQERVLNEIFTDLKAPYRMNRLLQGDVGSGKTIIAAIALLSVVLSGKQGAMMVPTEILAEQHWQSLTALLDATGVTVGLLTSSLKAAAKRDMLHALKEGYIDIIVGTHALIQEQVEFKDLGLVITDEQHRFGVRQRRVLRDKGAVTDVLYMTATPIPRTLAISVFGEMDVSTIDELPKGRKPIETYWVKPDMMERVLSLISKELNAGRQAYVVCPLIEESEQLDVQNAIDVHQQLHTYFQDQFNVGLMHGRLDAKEKEAVMKQFTAGEVDLLVSTTVVEVGVNVPNATLMVIYDAERFGLSQLHQLRGRVGRGEHQSYCILLGDPKSDTGKERLQIMTETEDGFALSERDLELRGPGDFFGDKQSGLPEFRLGDMVHDYRALEVARKDATELVASAAFWEDDLYGPLREKLRREDAFFSTKLD
ncbi:ATP-dependent DNA helicase RecG [Aureibacillus halotolerans]|uniref:ATP-dependent DNA helicase RecG n=1 Tax=Aureibacillus halotolerans TaxID=1508390 RepID=A0A4R6UCA3_9BACI|nr:ATP-dependent DNA helicase RecG [Aureibacillus halotolerans]TDQ42385.1 ATP-dependent DNA helicase RecG [Aureibacillus halotolerans]